MNLSNKRYLKNIFKMFRNCTLLACKHCDMVVFKVNKAKKIQLFDSHLRKYGIGSLQQ